MGVTDQLRSAGGGGKGTNNAAATANGSYDSRSAQPSPLLQPGRAVTSSPGRSENSDAGAHTSPILSFHSANENTVLGPRDAIVNKANWSLPSVILSSKRSS